VDDGPKSGELVDLLTEIATMSEQITVDLNGDPLEAGGRRPSFVVRRAGTDVKVAFAGIPLGHEFTSLVLALLQVGGHPAKAARR
jgi:alkyl hydroperoxide reductase subunit F